MPSSYTPVATKHASITIPSDGDAHAATTYAPGYQQCADRTEYALLYARHQVSAQAVLAMTIRTAGSGSTNNLNRIVASGNTAVAVGASGEIQTSEDGTTWTKQTPAASYAGAFLGAAYSLALDLFVITGNGVIQASSAGSSWASRTPAVSGNINGAAASVTVVVAVGASGSIQTSPDTVTWTSRSAAGGYTGTFNDVCWTGSLFVAVGTGGEIQTSPDGVTWTKRTPASSFAGTFSAVSWSGSVLVASGPGGGPATVQTSTDGITWTSRTAPYLGSRARWCGKTFLWLGEDGIYSTPNPATIDFESGLRANYSLGGMVDAAYLNRTAILVGVSAGILQSNPF